MDVNLELIWFWSDLCLFHFLLLFFFFASYSMCSIISSDSSSEQHIPCWNISSELNMRCEYQGIQWGLLKCCISTWIRWYARLCSLAATYSHCLTKLIFNLISRAFRSFASIDISAIHSSIHAANELFYVLFSFSVSCECV